jgi:hypothetical protein
VSYTVLTRKSLSLFAALGGWRTVVEGVVSRVVFLVAYLVTGRVSTSALVAVGGVAVLALVRVWADRKYWSAAIGLGLVGVSALLAGSTGHAVDFYLPALLIQSVQGVVFLLSVLVGWPVVGLVMGAARGERFAWRRDRGLRRRYGLCTMVFVVKCGIATALMVPLYFADQVTALGIAATLTAGAPAAGACIYLSWRILRTPTANGKLFRVTATGTHGHAPD